MDDSSFNVANAQALEGITSINAGESVVFLLREAAQDTASLAAAFKTFWGGIDSIQIGTFLDSGTGFSSNGDGVVVFDASVPGTEVSPRAQFPSAASSTGFSFRFTDTGVFAGLSEAGQFGAFVSANALGNVGSPGLSVIPEPSSITLALLGLVAGGYGLCRSRRGCGGN
jgi:hypothetical protein